MKKQRQRSIPHFSRTWVVFVFTIVLPSIFLSWLGLRIVLQEKIVAEEETRGRLNRIADEAALALEGELELWQSQIDGPASGPLNPADPSSCPERIREILGIPGAAVLVTVEKDRILAMPRQQLLYSLDRAADIADPPPILAAADELEHIVKDYGRALSEYHRLLAVNRDPVMRPCILEGLARVSWKAGRRAEALRAYSDLAKTPDVMVGSLPAGLIAGCQICSLLKEAGPSEVFTRSALKFYRALSGGEWQLDRGSYHYYAGKARDWLENDALQHAEYMAARQLEERKAGLTEAVEILVQSWQSNRETRPVLPTSLHSGPALHLAFWHADPSRPAAQVLVISAQYLREHFLPRIFAQASGRNFHLRLSGERGETLYCSYDPAAPPEKETSFAGSRNLQAHGAGWRIDAWPRAPEAVNRDIQRRQWLYTGMLLLMLASLLFGVFANARSLRNQLEIARLKSDFISAVSHEFRSPLTGIRQLAEMLGSGRVTSEERKTQFYGMIGREAERLTHLVENALGFARAAETTIRYRFERIDTSGWLRETVERFGQSHPAKGASVISSIPDSLPPLIVDPESMSGAIENLLDNAVKFSPEGKTVWFDVAVQGNQVVIRVRDRGIGISAEDQKHIFERFFRGGNPLVRKVCGTGLGLSLVREVVAAHNGNVDFESCPGEGSTFSIRLNAAE